jgi:hypothetical protein
MAVAGTSAGGAPGRANAARFDTVRFDTGLGDPGDPDARPVLPLAPPLVPRAAGDVRLEGAGLREPPSRAMADMLGDRTLP